ncbi:Uncharacterised protein [Mobiluncus mulieris]|nr:Uncharacterised protein [Mobiluncus mulieris]
MELTNKERRRVVSYSDMHPDICVFTVNKLRFVWV